MLNNLLRRLKKKPKFLMDNAGKIKEAFVYRGRTYYTFEDIFTIPTIRGLQAVDYYDEFSMRCTRDFLKRMVEAMKEVLSPAPNKKLELIKLATLVKYLEERLVMLPVPDHVYRLASVMFFDEEEDPFYFDRKKADRKIMLWKKDPEILAFFLRSPLKDLIPYLDLDGINLSTYSSVVDKVNEIHLSAVTALLSRNDMKVDM